MDEKQWSKQIQNLIQSALSPVSFALTALPPSNNNNEGIALDKGSQNHICVPPIALDSPFIAAIAFASCERPQVIAVICPLGSARTKDYFPSDWT
ncbi:hypothetical protein CEXT_72481 [Caerostris extrusa]|uniref:Uncharacterized protein n=1 Tax=Caerostris extrusa TaxID=172846 RepID=A0AAV4XRT3_CAEEX|nr:hypothetical protein CEXT_72481 [Caerostris extrusa]